MVPVDRTAVVQERRAGAVLERHAHRRLSFCRARYMVVELRSMNAGVDRAVDALSCDQSDEDGGERLVDKCCGSVEEGPERFLVDCRVEYQFDVHVHDLRDVRDGRDVRDVRDCIHYMICSESGYLMS